MAALELATASSDSGLDATRDRTCSYSSVVRRHRCDHRPHHGQPTSVRDCVQRERSKSVRLPSNTRYVSSTRRPGADRRYPLNARNRNGNRPRKCGPISLSEKRCRTRAFNVEDFVLGLVQLFDQGDGKHFYAPIPSLCTSVVTRARLSFFRALSIVESAVRERSVVTSIGCKNRAIGTKHLSKSYIC